MTTLRRLNNTQAVVSCDDAGNAEWVCVFYGDRLVGRIPASSCDPKAIEALLASEDTA